MPLLFTFPSSTYKLLPSSRRFPAILLTSITVAPDTLPYLGLGDQTALGIPFNPHHRSIRRSRFGLQIEHNGLSTWRSLAQFIYKRVCQRINSCTAPSACSGSRLSEASPFSVATDTEISVLFTLQIISVMSVRRCASLRIGCTLRCLEAGRLRRYLSRGNIWRAVWEGIHTSGVLSEH